MKIESPWLAHFKRGFTQFAPVLLQLFMNNKHKSLETWPERPMDNTRPH